jgi:UDP-perosamine 4-acetyltransferase
MSLVVIGAGGHALVVLDAALSGSLPVAGLVDQVVPAGQMIGAVQVLGDDTLFQDPSFVQAHPFHLSMSNPAVKQRLAESLQAHSTTIVSIIHPTAIVSLSAGIEAGVFINAGADVNAGAQIGSHAIVNTRASIDHGCRIGAAVHVAPGVTICGDVVVGEAAEIGPSALIGRGMQIGAGAVIGAGGVVLSDVAATSRVLGVPARPAGK